MSQSTISRPTHRTFAVADQLRAKLGTKEFGALLDQLHAVAKPRRKRGKRS